jgi:hypothetical protein
MVLIGGVFAVAFDPQNKHWVYAACGVVFGYWLGLGQ